MYREEILKIVCCIEGNLKEAALDHIFEK